jgi:hypothetical protein
VVAAAAATRPSAAARVLISATLVTNKSIARRGSVVLVACRHQAVSFLPGRAHRREYVPTDQRGALPSLRPSSAGHARPCARVRTRQQGECSRAQGTSGAHESLNWVGKRFGRLLPILSNRTYCRTGSARERHLAPAASGT